MGGLSGDEWPVSPWPVPRAEGQEVARDPVRIQELLCLSVSNHYQILHSNSEQAQAPLTESLEGYVRALQFCFIIIQLPAMGGFMASCLNSVYMYFSPADTNSVIQYITGIKAELVSAQRLI